MGIDDVNVATFDDAQTSITKLDLALEQISKSRATAGAQINRLEYTITNLNTTRENMIAYLKKETGLEKTVTFGSIEGKYDVVVSEYDQNKVVKTLKKMYEPFLWEPKR